MIPALSKIAAIAVIAIFGLTLAGERLPNGQGGEVRAAEWLFP